METKKLKIVLDSKTYKYAQRLGSGFVNPLFAYVSPPKGGKVYAKTDFIFCRESFCEYLRTDLRGLTHFGININKLHMGLYRRLPSNPKTLDKTTANFHQEVLFALQIVNTIEQHYGWPLTRAYLLEIDESQSDILPCNKFYYLTASKRWIKSPHMLSLYTLLIRIAATKPKLRKPEEITSLKTLFKYLDFLSARDHRQEVAFYHEHGAHWEIILSNYRKLFASRTMKDLYYPNTKSWFFTEGINTLSDRESKDIKLNTTYKKILKGQI